MRDYLRYMGFPMYAPNGLSGAAASEQKPDASAKTADDEAPTGDEADDTAAPSKKKTDDAQQGDDDDDGEGTEEDPANDDAAASEAARKLASRRRTMQGRLDAVTGKFRDAERRAIRAESELADLRARRAKGYDDEVNPDLSLTLDQRREAELTREHKAATEDQSEARAEAWKERVSDFQEKHDDFEKVAYSAPVSDATAEMIADMEEGPAVAYHLGKNHAEARRIDRLSRLQKAVELGRIAERVTSTPMQRITKAPTPIKNGVSGSGRSGAQPKFGSMSNSDYAAVVAAEEKAKHQR